jgi:hypothetical protein
MQHRPSFDRRLLVTIVIGMVSILGIVWIFLTAALDQSPIAPTALPSNLSSRDTATPAPSPSATLTQDNAPLTTSKTDLDPSPESPTGKLPSTRTLSTESIPTPSATYTPIQIQTLPAGRYDDMDPNISYGPYWTALKNPGTANAYKGTIHASTGIGNEASFRFTGKRLLLGYQRGKNFGTVTVIIDDQQYSFHEQAFDLVWSSPKLSPGDHFVRIIHDSGESINLDYIDIVD